MQIDVFTNKRHVLRVRTVSRRSIRDKITNNDDLFFKLCYLIDVIDKVK